MPNYTNNRTRRFSYTEPILYMGESYPSAKTDIVNDRGLTSSGTIFATNNGEYYTLDSNDNAMPAIISEELPEVEVRPSQDEMLSAAFNRYLTMSNDKSRVDNVPHREYNSHLRESALNGAKAHASWDKEHPNLASWRDFATAVPFGVASIPLLGGLGDTALGTSIGKAIASKAESTLNGPIMQLANNAISVGFASKGVNDISQGIFTPDTALDLLGFPLGFNAERNVYQGLRRNKYNLGRYITNESSIPRSIKKEGARRYTDFVHSSEYQNRLENAGLENQWDNIKALTDRQLNGFGYFPGRNQKIIDNKPLTLGQSDVKGDILSNPWYGITLKSSLYPNRVMPTLDHEIAHWATKNAGVENNGFLGDIMRYNEGIAPNTPWGTALIKEIEANPNITIDDMIELEKRYDYLTDPQEKRARAFSIYQQAKDKNKTTDEFVDRYTRPNGEISDFAPGQLRDMSLILTNDNLKKYLNNFLGISAPVGIGASLMYNQNR